MAVRVNRRYLQPSTPWSYSETLPNPGIDIHIDADGLIRDNSKRLRFRSGASLHLEDVIPRRQLNAIVSLLVCDYFRDFFFSIAASDD